jgi:DNA-binding NarL/FixJ family response regulator
MRGERRAAPRGTLPTSKPITVVLARFDDLLQGGLNELLGRDESIEIVAGGVEQRRLSVVLSGHRPDVAVLDAGALHRLVEVRELLRRHPRTKLVLLAHEPSAAECAQAVAFGASACLGTATQGRDVLSAIHLASRGMSLTPDVPASVIRDAGGSGLLLTAREAEVLPLLREGRSNAQIALTLGVGVETVRTHTRNIYKKLGVSSRRELLAPPQRPPDGPPEPAHRGRRRPLPATSRSRGGHRSRPH